MGAVPGWGRLGGEGPFLALAPMDGVTDAVFRGLLTELGGGRSGISACVSEFVRICQEPAPARVLLQHCPELRAGGRTRAGVPVIVQLLGGAPGPMARTAALAAAMGAPGIDLNFGCPAKTVNNHDGGAALLRCPARIEAIVAAVREAVPPEVPVSAKIRVGWASSAGIEAIAAAAAAGGASWLTVHARTRAQGYAPPVEWPAIGRARAAAGIGVIANGDVVTPADAARCAAESGCEAFMIGRGAMVDPWAFAALRGWREGQATMAELEALWHDYYGRMVAAGAAPGRALCRVKQWVRFAAERRADARALFAAVKTCERWEAAAAVIAAHAGGRGGRGPLAGGAGDEEAADSEASRRRSGGAEGGESAGDEAAAHLQ